MDIEKLTKSQIILLTLLVSFVTSIATGIVTVSLMDQAPQTVTQTINRVVERTIERVVPEETQTATVITKERTVVVKESELIAQAIDRVSPSVVALHAPAESEKGERGVFIARGVVAAPGVVVTRNVDVAHEALTIFFEDGSVFEATRMQDKPESELALFSFIGNKESPIEPAAFVTATPKLGQSIIALTGSRALHVANGIVTGFASDAQSATKTSLDTKASEAENELSSTDFEINIAANALVPGSIVINTDGAVVGIARGNSTRIMPSTSVLSLLEALSSDGSVAQEGKKIEGGVEIR